MSDLPPPPPPSSGPPPGYGAPPGYGYGPQPQRTNGLAIAALVCGIVGLLLFGIILGPLAFIFGLVSMGQINNSNGTQKGKGMSIAGIVLGIVDVLGAILFFSTFS